jgi:hypothetical protein
MADNDLSTCTCIDCTPERWLPQPPPADDAWPDDQWLYDDDDAWPADDEWPDDPGISPEATARPFWRLKAWWSRLTHR